MTNALAGPKASVAKQYRAEVAAIAQLELKRVYAARLLLLRQAMQRQRDEDPDAEIDEVEARAFESVLDELQSLDRYERRSLSRRKNAFRCLDHADVQEHGGQ